MKPLILTLFLTCFWIELTQGQNQNPVAVNDTVWGFANYPIRLNILKNDYDPDGDEITLSYSSWGLVKINDTTWEVGFTPKYGAFYNPYRGKSIYRIQDVHGNLSNYALVIIMDKVAYKMDFLDINNFRAMISPFGHHFWNGDTASCEVPKVSGKSPLYCSTVWMGGYTETGDLHIAAELYRQNGSDFYPGPISDSYDTNYFKRWNRVWKLNKTDIQYHMNNWYKPGYKAIDAIETWPALGDTSLGQQLYYAPFFDYNGDMVYNPYNGDYPLIRGDQAVFFVMNDAQYIHFETKSAPLGIEITAMAYAYNRPDDSTLNNSVFFHYDILNRSQSTYNDTYLGIFTIFDSWHYPDICSKKYMGTDVTNGMVYGYFGVPIDGNGEYWSYGEHPPAIGVKVIGGPYLLPDGIDNPRGNCDEGINGLNFEDGIIDNERSGLFFSMARGWRYSNWYFEDFYNPYIAMKGYYFGAKESLPMHYGDTQNTLGSGGVCRYVYPGNTDTLCNWGTYGVLPGGGFNQNGYYWDEPTIGNIPGSRDGLASVGPFTVSPMQTVPFDFCYVWARDYQGDNFSSAELLRERISAISPQLPELIKLPVSGTGLTEKDKTGLIRIYPNPTSDEVCVELEEKTSQAYGLYSLSGKILKQGTLLPGRNMINIRFLNAGIYLLKINSSISKIVKF